MLVMLLSLVLATVLLPASAMADDSESPYLGVLADAAAGRGVPRGAVQIAPPIPGFAALTNAVVFAIYLHSS